MMLSKDPPRNFYGKQELITDGPADGIGECVKEAWRQAA